VRGTGAAGVAAMVLLAGCTVPRHHVAAPHSPLPAASTTLAVATVSTTPSSPPSPSPVDLPPPAASYVESFDIVHGPSVPVMVQRGNAVLLPGSRQIRLHLAKEDGGACSSFLAVSPSGRWLAYTATNGDLRVLDTVSRNIWSLGTGCSPVWGAGGLAYLMATRPDSLGAYRSAIVVRETPLAHGTVWARGQLLPIAWVGKRLLYGSSRSTQPATVLVLSSRPGGGHGVPSPAPDAAREGHLVASSPDGRRMLLQLDGAGADGRPRAHLVLVDTETLRTLSTVVPKGFEGLGTGTWIGDQVVAANGIEPGDSSHPPIGLIRLSVARDRLRIEKVAVPTKVTDAVNDYLTNIHWIGGDEVAVTHSWSPHAWLLSCRIATLVCTVILRLG
jgi:hypothetical protein